MRDCVTVLTTVATAAEANSLAQALVERKLAACVQSFPVTSCYFWDGKINNDAEILLFIKTRRELYQQSRNGDPRAARLRYARNHLPADPGRDRSRIWIGFLT